MLQGRELVERIPARLDQQTDDARARAAKEFAGNFREFVNSRITAEESLEAFAVYRRFDLAQTRGGQSSSVESMKVSAAKLCDDLAVHFESIPKPVISSFVSEHWGDYASKRSLLFAARSRGTHVAGVLRPLSKRYLKQWEAELTKRTDLGDVQRRVELLLNESIGDLNSFERWTESVFALFAEIGVYRGPGGNSTPGNKPNGMISEGSLRTYKQQWFSWTSENAMSLIGEGTGPAVSSGPISSEKTEASSLEIAQPARGNGVRISLHRRVDPTFKLEKVWPSVDSLLTGIDSWFEIADKVWGKSEATVVELDCLERHIDLELRFEADNLDSALRKVKAILAASL